MPRTLIQEHSSAIIRALVERVNAINRLTHSLSKGILRELFVTNTLKSFLSSQFGIGSGFIVNQEGIPSKQMDIIIYDNRILPPFIKEQNIGVYPTEGVLAAIEVKSWLSKGGLLKSIKAFKHLHETVYDPKSDIYSDYQNLLPLCAVIGFRKKGLRELNDDTDGRNWLNKNATNTIAICLVDKYCWIKFNRKLWSLAKADNVTYNETKRFISVLLDNIRTYSEKRINLLLGDKHKDWLSIYTREQELFQNR